LKHQDPTGTFFKENHPVGSPMLEAPGVTRITKRITCRA
jgi:hypothetical protein